MRAEGDIVHAVLVDVAQARYGEPDVGVGCGVGGATRAEDRDRLSGGEGLTGGTARDDRDLAGDVQDPAARGRALRVVRIPLPLGPHDVARDDVGAPVPGHIARASRERAPQAGRELAEPRLLGRGVERDEGGLLLAGLGLGDRSDDLLVVAVGLLALARHVDGPYVDAALRVRCVDALQRVVSSARNDAEPRAGVALTALGGDECRMVRAGEIEDPLPRVEVLRERLRGDRERTGVLAILRAADEEGARILPAVDPRE